MALATLSVPTEAIVDHILQTVNADVRRGAPETYSPRTQFFTGLATALGGTETFVEVFNGHMWPRSGQISISTTGAGVDLVNYNRVTTVRNTRPVTWDGRGNAPIARLHLVPGTTVANAHTVAAVVAYQLDVAESIPSSMSSGLVGIQDISGFLRSLIVDVTPAGAFTATGDGAAGGTTFVDGAATFTAGAMVGDTLNITSGACSGESSTIIANTATTLTVFPAFTAQIVTGVTATITITNMNARIAQLDTTPPVNYTSTGARGSTDTSVTPLGATEWVLDAIGHVIDQYGGTRPTFDPAADPHGHTIIPRTKLSKPAVTADTIIDVLDASVLPGAGGVCLIGGAIGNRTVLRNFAKRGGQGPNRIQFTAAMGAGVAAGVDVSVVGATADTGAYSRYTVPFARDKQFEAFLLAAIAAVEAYTLPA